MRRVVLAFGICGIFAIAAEAQQNFVVVEYTYKFPPPIEDSKTVVSKYDILGLRLGTSPDALSQSAKASGFFLDNEGKGSLGSTNDAFIGYVVKAVNPTEWINFQRFSKSSSEGSETVSVQFGTVFTGNKSTQIQRDITFDQGKAPLASEFEAALVAKYGKPVGTEDGLGSYKTLCWDMNEGIHNFDACKKSNDFHLFATFSISQNATVSQASLKLEDFNALIKERQESDMAYRSINMEIEAAAQRMKSQPTAPPKF